MRKSSVPPPKDKCSFWSSSFIDILFFHSNLFYCVDFLLNVLNHILKGYVWVSLVVHMVKCLLAMRKTWVQSLDWKDPLEKEMATHSSTLAWKIPWMEEPGRLQSMGLQRIRHDWETSHWLSKVMELFQMLFYKHCFQLWYQSQFYRCTKITLIVLKMLVLVSSTPAPKRTGSWRTVFLRPPVGSPVS